MNDSKWLWFASLLATGTLLCALPWLLERLMPGPDIVFDDWSCALVQTIVSIAPYVGGGIVILGVGTCFRRLRATRTVVGPASIGNKDMSNARA